MQVNTMNNEEFELNGRIFIRSTYLDISVLIDKETGYYYAQKICDDNNKVMRDLERNDDYELMKQAVASTVRICAVELETTFPGMPNGYRSKWVHKLLVNYIAQWANKEYAVKIAMLLNLIDERLKLENRTLQQEIDGEKHIIQQLRSENDNLTRTLNEIRQQNNQLLQKNSEQSSEINNLQETIDELYNMNLSSGVTIRSMDKKLTDVRTAVEEVHNEVSTIRVKDKKLHRTRDVLILYTSPDKPRDNELREHAPEGYTWIGTFNGQPRNFSSSAPRNRTVIFESESNRLDTFKDILEKETISRYIHDRTKYRDILVRNDQIELLFQAITEELNRDDTFESVTNLEDTLTNNNVNDAEIRLKQQLLQQHSPLLINLNRYKRRIYANVNDELVLVEDVQNPEEYEWMYRYGPNGTKFGKLDLDVLRTSRFTNERDTRITYE